MKSEKPDNRKLLSQEQMIAVSSAMWETLQLMVKINNAFLERMQAFTTLGPEDERELELWSKAIARASQGVLDTLEKANARPDDKALN